MKKLLRLLAFLLALLMLCGCTASDLTDGAADDRQDSAQTAPEDQSAEQKTTSVRVLMSLEVRNAGEDSACAITYDENGITMTDQYGDVYVYDLRGRLVLRQDYWDGALDRYYEYAYDDQGNLLSNLCFGAEGTAKGSSYFYFYDAQNRMIRLESRSDTGYVQEYSEYTYYDNGKLKSQCRYDLNGELRTEIQYTQNSVGQTVHCQYTHCEYTDFCGERTYRYDAQGRMLEDIWDDGSTMVDSNDYFYTYDEAGRQTGYRAENEFGVVETIQYAYDDEGYLISFTREQEDGSSVTVNLIYGELELPEDIAAAAASWSKDGVISYYCETPDPAL